MELSVPDKEALDKLYDEIQNERCITEVHLKNLIALLGNRVKQSFKAVEDGRVKKYLFHPSEKSVWIVVGKEGDYQILPRAHFCSCDDFYFRVISNEAFLCYHLIAQKLSEALGTYILIEKPDEDYEPLMSEWRKIKIEKRQLSILEVENVRRIVEAILSEVNDLSTSQLLEEVGKNGFHLTIRHLVNILITDKRKRFKCRRELWSLIKSL